MFLLCEMILIERFQITVVYLYLAPLAMARVCLVLLSFNLLSSEGIGRREIEKNDWHRGEKRKRRRAKKNGRKSMGTHIHRDKKKKKKKS